MMERDLPDRKSGGWSRAIRLFQAIRSVSGRNRLGRWLTLGFGVIAWGTLTLIGQVNLADV
jgi:hypothetical protein